MKLLSTRENPGGRSAVKIRGRKHAVIALTTLLALVSGCSSSEQPTPSSSASSTSAAATSSSTSSVTAAPVPPTPRVGIVVQSKLKGLKPELGVIDPVTGEYGELATFDLPSDTSGVAEGFPRNVVETAPDLERVAITTRAGAGWVDRLGAFTNVNVEAAPGPFGGAAATYSAIGFNGRGDFFYERSAPDTGREVYRLPFGQTGPGTKEPTTDLLDAWITRDGNGELVVASVTCLIGPGNWFSPTEYVFVDGQTQLVRTIAAAPACSSDGGTALLPQANTSQVSNPVVSPDGASVAFRRNADEIWVTSAAGGGEPRQLAVTGASIDFSDAYLIGWTGE